MHRSGDGGSSRRTGLSRRSFLVLAGGLTLGRFPLPPPAARPTAKARRLVGPPTRWGDGGRNLPWNERTDSGDVETSRVTSNRIAAYASWVIARLRTIRST
jgi:hypothetical protein